MLYLASPYSHADPAIREARYQAACSALTSLIRNGKVAFSPIVHSHPLTAHGLPMGWQFWRRLDRHFLGCCDEVAVLTLEGWRESVGVQEEIRLARELGKPVWFMAELIPEPEWDRLEAPDRELSAACNEPDTEKGTHDDACHLP